MTLVTQFWVFPHGFLAQPQPFAVRGYFSPHCWEQTGRCLQRRRRSGTSGLGLPHPAWQSTLCSLLSPPDTSPCKATSPCPAARPGNSASAWSQPTRSCHRSTEGDSEVGSWPCSPCLRTLHRCPLAGLRSVRGGRGTQLGVCLSVPCLFPLARRHGFSARIPSSGCSFRCRARAALCVRIGAWRTVLLFLSSVAKALVV